MVKKKKIHFILNSIISFTAQQQTEAAGDVLSPDR